MHTNTPYVIVQGFPVAVGCYERSSSCFTLYHCCVAHVINGLHVLAPRRIQERFSSFVDHVRATNQVVAHKQRYLSDNAVVYSLFVNHKRNDA